MKKALLSLFIVLCVPAVMSAQQKKDMYISGNFTIEGGNTSSTSGNTVTKTPGTLSFGIAPQFGYFVIDRLEVSLSLGYSLDRYANGQDSEGNNLFRRTNVFEIVPGGSSRDIDLQTTSKSGLTRFGLSLSAIAFEFRPADHFGITLRAGGLSYTMDRTSSKGSVKSTSTSNDVSFRINTGVGIGFKYYL